MRRALSGLLVLLALPCSALAWNGRLHLDISRAAAKSVPDEMAAWREYAKLMSSYSIYPDLWKDDPAEPPRHYLDLERYGVTTATALPRDRAQVGPVNGKPVPESDGIAPWAIMELMDRLTAAMASDRWMDATRIAAALGHYVGDIHQPLHVTEKFDGMSAAQQGVHLRWEDRMAKQFWRTSMMNPAPAEYIADPWTAVLGWMDGAFAQYPAILKADEEAVRAAQGDVESRAYYAALWERTKDVFTAQANAAAPHLGSLWYTAWVNAGKPEIPEPPEQMSEASVWGLVAAAPRAQPSALPFFAAFAAIAVVIILLSIRRSRAAA